MHVNSFSHRYINKVNIIITYTVVYVYVFDDAAANSYDTITSKSKQLL